MNSQRFEVVPNNEAHAEQTGQQMANYWMRCFLIPLFLTSLLLLTGCNGCNDDGKERTAAELEKEKEEEEKKKPKENFEFLSPVTFPGIFQKPLDPEQEKPTDEQRRRMAIRNRTKAGHWVRSMFTFR